MTESTIIAGGPGDFRTARHLIVQGDQMAIGRALAEEAVAISRWRPRPIDPVVNRARWTWFECNWPQQYARPGGVASALGVDLNRDDVCLDGLSTLPAESGCSAVWCPPSGAIDERGRLARNDDCFTFSEAELVAALSDGDGSVPMASRPAVVTMYPDDGLASIVLTMSDVDGCTEGVNEAGLSVALLHADLAATDPKLGAEPQVGLSVSQVPRYLLDTCENVEQAQRALLLAKQYDQGTPCHYIIADAAGNGFVYERGAGGSEHFVSLAEGPLCVPNHLLHRHPDIELLPEDNADTFGTYQRLRRLTKATAGVRSSGALVRDALNEVAMTAGVPEHPWRTRWQSVFDPAARRMTTRFYLGDAADGTLRFSEEITFGASR